MKICHVKVDGKVYYLIESEDGSNFILSMDSLNYLFKIIDISFDDDISFSFGGFSFFKSVKIIIFYIENSCLL